MKAPAFEYVKVRDLPGAFAALAAHGEDARVLAGGQSLMPMLNMRLAAPSCLIDINGLAELRGIAVEDGLLRIGALTRHAELAASTEVARHAPLLAKAIPHIAHPAIRNRGTIGGSCAHADPAAEYPACLLALDARFVAASAKGERTIEASDFFRGLYETALAPGEILIAIEVPSAPDGARSALVEIARRHGDYATVGIAAQARADRGALSDVRLAFFSISDRPLLAKNAAAAVEGTDLNESAIKAAQDVLDKDLTDAAGDLHTSEGTKRHLARVVCGRALRALAEGAKA